MFDRKRTRQEPEHIETEDPADFFTSVLGQAEPEFLSRMVESNPGLVLGLMEALEPQALAGIINEHPELFSRLLQTLPAQTVMDMINKQPDVMIEIVRNLDPKIMTRLAENIQPDAP